MAENRENQYSGQLSQGTGSREENKGGDSRTAVSGCLEQDSVWPVSYTHLTLPTN